MYKGNCMKQQQFWLCWTLCWGEFSFVMHCYLAQHLAPQAQRSIWLQTSCDYFCKKPAVYRNEQAMPVLPTEEMFSGSEPHVVLLPIVKRIIFIWLLAPDKVVSHPCHCLVHNSPFCPDINVSCQNKYRHKYQMAWSLLTRKIKSITCKTLRVHLRWESLNQWFFNTLTTSLARDKKVEKSSFTGQCLWCSHSTVLPCTSNYFGILCYCRD